MALLVIGGLLYIAVMSFFVSSVCGYMAGLIGSSNSPLSGIGILAVIGAALLLVFAVRAGVPVDAQQALVAFALFVTAVIFSVATIANNNLQDLKTGQLVDATPWKQQVALVIGVIAGAAIIPPILDLLNHAYGFVGAPGPHHDNPLPAPQAGLISALAQGVLQNNVDWSLIEIGVGIGVALIVIDDPAAAHDERAPTCHRSRSASASTCRPKARSRWSSGALVGWYFDRRAERRAQPCQHQAARRAARLGHARWRGPDRCDDRRPGGVFGQGFSALAGERSLRRHLVGRRRHGCLRQRGCAPVPVGCLSAPLAGGRRPAYNV